MLFKQLPPSMQQLTVAVGAMDDPGMIPPPPDMEDMGERLRRVYGKARKNGYSSLSRSEIRKLPFAYWVGESPVLSELEPELVKAYWDKYLLEALQASPRRAKRWLAPLFFVYCERFSDKDKDFSDFAARITALLTSVQGLYAQALRDLNTSVGFFNPNEAPRRIANYFFLNRKKGIDQQLQEWQLWPTFLQSPMGNSIFKAALLIDSNRFRDEDAAFFLIDWAQRGVSHVAKTEFRVSFANALLSPWVGHRPGDYLKNKLIDFFIQPKGYGDPRFENHKHYQWDGVSHQAKGVILHWLTGDTLRGFMKLLQRTADEIWQHRQKFWMAYYENGYIDEAWMALGEDAWWASKGLRKDEVGMGCGRLDGGASNNQSVLLLKIGGLVFTEWSHNGSLRAYEESSFDTPKFYQSSYHGADLRAATSLDFHNGQNMRPELTHAHSDKGSWQRKARDFIGRHTRVYLTDSEIL